MVIIGDLEKGHVDFLKKFVPTSPYERVELDLDQVYNVILNTGSVMSPTYQIYSDLRDYGLVETVFSIKEEREVVRLTGWGKTLLNQL